MARRYSKKVTKKRIFRLSPRDAENIIYKEFTDSHGNKHIFKVRFKPQNPFEPDFKQTVEYKENNND